MLGIPGTGSHLYVTGVQPEWDTRENLSLQFMFKTAADEDKALQADPTGISVSVENRGTDGQVRSEKTSVFICVDGQEDKLSIFGEDGAFVGGRETLKVRYHACCWIGHRCRCVEHLSGSHVACNGSDRRSHDLVVRRNQRMVLELDITPHNYAL